MAAMTPEKLFESASRYERLGYKCLPVRLELDATGKKRVIPPKQWQMRSFTKAADWTANGFVPNGIATNCGTSGIVVVDVDTGPGKDGGQALLDAGLKLRPGAVVSTQSGGFHGFFKRGDVRLGHDSHSKIADGVDIKAFGMLILPPSVVEGGGEYTWRGDAEAIPAVADLPVFPDEVAKTLLVDKSRTAHTVEEVDPAELTDSQRAAGVILLNKKISALEDLKDGERFEGLGKVIRIAGIAKSLGEDPAAIAKRVVDAYEMSGGTSTAQVTSAIESAWTKASPDDPSVWPVEDLTEAEFWHARPSLQKIQQAAFARHTAPWAVLGGVLARVLADVPTNHRLDSGIGSPTGGVLNFFAVIAAESGGSKSNAMGVANYLWPTDVYTTELSSGEALPRLYRASRYNKLDGTYEDVVIRDAVIADIDEFSSLRSAAQRQGATLAAKLSTAFTGGSISLSTADPAKTVSVPAGSYRLCLTAAIQYSNAKMILNPGDTALGFAQRFVWFPANSKLPDTAPKMPARFSQTMGGPLGRLDIQVPELAKREITAGIRANTEGTSADPLNSHRLFCQLKLAYGLAVLDGHYMSVRETDWALAKTVMAQSDVTREKAQGTIRSIDAEAEWQLANRDGFRRAASSDAEADAKFNSHCDKLLKALSKAYQDPATPWLSTSMLKKAIRYEERETYGSECIAAIVESGQAVKTEVDGSFRYSLAPPPEKTL